MATDFSNSVITAGGIQPSSVNTPGDIRTRVVTEADILNIPLPYIGMIVYCEDTDKYYKINSLKAKSVGFNEVEDAAVDTYEELNIKKNSGSGAGGNIAIISGKSKFGPAFGASPYFGQADDLAGNVTIYSEDVRKQLILNYSLYGIKEYPIIIHISFNESTGKFYIVEDLNIIKNVIDYGLELGVYPICIKMHAQKYNEEHINNYGHNKFYNIWLGFIEELAAAFKKYNSIKYLTVHNEVGYLYNTDTHEQFVLNCLDKAKKLGYKTGVTCAGFSNLVKIKESVINNSDAVFVNHYQPISDKGTKTTKRDSVLSWQSNIFNWIDYIKNKYAGKPIIISESGVQNNWYALCNPGRWDWDNIHYSPEPVGIYLYGLLEVLKDCEDIERVWWWYDIVGYKCCQELLNEYLKGVGANE
jgi:hypothetical protein